VGVEADDVHGRPLRSGGGEGALEPGARLGEIPAPGRRGGRDARPGREDGETEKKAACREATTRSLLFHAPLHSVVNKVLMFVREPSWG
jgi:hypothetical protein